MSGAFLRATDRLEKLESIKRWTNTLLVLIFSKGFVTSNNTVLIA